MARALKLCYYTTVNALLLLLALELGMRLLHKPEELAKASVRDVPYQLHPFFQSSFPLSTAVSRDPRFYGWPTNPELPAGFEEGRQRILFLGGSTTACRYPHLVRWLLEQQQVPATAFIAGYDWHCSLHSLYKLETYADTVQPDLIVVLEGINDFYRGFTSPALSLPEYREDYSHYAGALYPFWQSGLARGDARPAFFAQPIGRFAHEASHDDSLGGWFRALAHESLLVRSLRSAAPPVEEAQTIVSMEQDAVLRALPAFERNMRSLVRSAKRRGIPTVLLSMPWSLGSARTFLAPAWFFTNDGLHMLDEAGFDMGMRRFAETVEQLGRDEGVEVVSMHREITDAALFQDEVHLTDAGQEQEARALVREILLRKLLPRQR
ncbi:MAG: GDSL-type esterase/lipase family protein [Planctomycetia bacterium]